MAIVNKKPKRQRANGGLFKIAPWLVFWWILDSCKAELRPVNETPEPPADCSLLCFPCVPRVDVPGSLLPQVCWEDNFKWFFFSSTSKPREEYIPRTKVFQAFGKVIATFSLVARSKAEMLGCQPCPFNTAAGRLPFVGDKTSFLVQECSRLSWPRDRGPCVPNYFWMKSPAGK